MVHPELDKLFVRLWSINDGKVHGRCSKSALISRHVRPPPSFARRSNSSNELGGSTPSYSDGSTAGVKYPSNCPSASHTCTGPSAVRHREPVAASRMT